VNNMKPRVVPKDHNKCCMHCWYWIPWNGKCSVTLKFRLPEMTCDKFVSVYKAG